MSGGLSDALREDVDIKRKLEFNSFRQIPGFIGCLRKVTLEKESAINNYQNVGKFNNYKLSNVVEMLS